MKFFTFDFIISFYDVKGPLVGPAGSREKIFKVSNSDSETFIAITFLTDIEITPVKIFTFGLTNFMM